MTIKREAAFHEAGHAVAAYRSKFHAIVGEINLAEYGAGEAHVSLSGKKLRANGKAVSVAAAGDREVAGDLAVVLAAGLVAERVAASHDAALTLVPGCAFPDHELMQQVLAGAGLSMELAHYEGRAEQVLRDDWTLVGSLAEYLLRQESVGAISIIDFLDDKASVRGGGE